MHPWILHISQVQAYMTLSSTGNEVPCVYIIFLNGVQGTFAIASVVQTPIVHLEARHPLAVIYYLERSLHNRTWLHWTSHQARGISNSCSSHWQTKTSYVRHDSIILMYSLAIHISRVISCSVVRRYGKEHIRMTESPDFGL